MNDLLTKLESHIALGPVSAAKLLGYSYSTYAQYRSGLRPLPRYARHHVSAVMRLTRKQLDGLIKEVVFNA